eukprot:TRINITY_DN4572_c0_g1_i1.p1 TRINITY_DN4572_c0_g1~~TRINITY_DN4572_c0_g1_i1.p1  ORF type:complete len:484 (-),score=84.08 TRINITY_DN4572_c0_g1_i1:147-1598(-)
MVLWILLSIILLPLVVMLIRLSYSMVKYFYYSQDYKNFWKYPTFGTLLTDGVNINTGALHMYSIVPRQPNGSFIKFANLGFYIGAKPGIMVSDRETIKMILSSKEGFPKLAHTYDDLLAQVLGKGLVTSSGDIWFSERRLITPFFHFQNLKNFYPKMVDNVNNFVSTLNSAKWSNGRELFMGLTAKVINNLAFGGYFDTNEVVAEFKDLTERFNMWLIGYTLFGSLWGYVPHKYGSGLFQTKRNLHNKISKVVDECRRKKCSEDTSLINYLSLANSNGKYLPHSLILDECLTFLFAGIDTSASTLSWIMYLLSLNPRVQEKIQEEVDSVIGDRIPSLDDEPNLVYCSNVLKETLRVYPVVPLIDRSNDEKIVVDDYIIPKDSSLTISIYSLHHDPNIWKDPEMFIPERWENPDSKNNFVWTPFSAGPRNCIGSKFATQEIIIAIAMIFQKLNVVHNDAKKVVPLWEGVVAPYNLELKFNQRKK